MLPLAVERAATAPVLDGFGASTLVPSQGNDAARRLFAQGIAQAYAFNEDEAVRSFKAALAQDPDCGMCAWGVALQSGPNINSTERGELREAINYVGHALRLSKGVSARDLALITRWPCVMVIEPRAPSRRRQERSAVPAAPKSRPTRSISPTPNICNSSRYVFRTTLMCSPCTPKRK